MIVTVIVSSEAAFLLSPEYLTVIVVVPFPTAVIKPADVTLAILSSAVKYSRVPTSGFNMALICEVSSTFSESSLPLVTVVEVSYFVTVTVISLDDASCVLLPANLTVKIAVPAPTALN